MRIWQMIGYDEGSNTSYFHFALKRQAERYGQDWMRDNPKGSWDLYPLDYPSTREGVAKLLDQLITHLCINEH